MTRTALHVLNGIVTVLIRGRGPCAVQRPRSAALDRDLRGRGALLRPFPVRTSPASSRRGAERGLRTRALYLLIRVIGASDVLAPTGQEMIGVTEPGREMVGLLLTAGWTGVLALQQRPSRVAAGEEGGPRDSTVPE